MAFVTSIGRLLCQGHEQDQQPCRDRNVGCFGFPCSRPLPSFCRWMRGPQRQALKVSNQAPPPIIQQPITPYYITGVNKKLVFYFFSSKQTYHKQTQKLSKLADWRIVQSISYSLFHKGHQIHEHLTPFQRQGGLGCILYLFLDLAPAKEQGANQQMATKVAKLLIEKCQ